MGRKGGWAPRWGKTQYQDGWTRSPRSGHYRDTLSLWVLTSFGTWLSLSLGSPLALFLPWLPLPCLGGSIQVCVSSPAHVSSSATGSHSLSSALSIYISLSLSPLCLSASVCLHPLPKCPSAPPCLYSSCPCLSVLPPLWLPLSPQAGVLPTGTPSPGLHLPLHLRLPLHGSVPPRPPHLLTLLPPPPACSDSEAQMAGRSRRSGCKHRAVAASGTSYHPWPRACPAAVGHLAGLLGTPTHPGGAFSSQVLGQTTPLQSRPCSAKWGLPATEGGLVGGLSPAFLRTSGKGTPDGSLSLPPQGGVLLDV